MLLTDVSYSISKMQQKNKVSAAIFEIAIFLISNTPRRHQKIKKGGWINYPPVEINKMRNVCTYEKF